MFFLTHGVVYGYSSSQCTVATLLRELTCRMGITQRDVPSDRGDILPPLPQIRRPRRPLLTILKAETRPCRETVRDLSEDGGAKHVVERLSRDAVTTEDSHHIQQTAARRQQVEQVFSMQLP